LLQCSPGGFDQGRVIGQSQVVVTGKCDVAFTIDHHLAGLRRFQQMTLSQTVLLLQGKAGRGLGRAWLFPEKMVKIRPDSGKSIPIYTLQKSGRSGR
jgi:hypothetical protein